MTSIYISMRNEGQRLIIDGSLHLFNQLLKVVEGGEVQASELQQRGPLPDELGQKAVTPQTAVSQGVQHDY